MREVHPLACSGTESAHLPGGKHCSILAEHVPVTDRGREPVRDLGGERFEGRRYILDYNKSWIQAYRTASAPLKMFDRFNL